MKNIGMTIQALLAIAAIALTGFGGASLAQTGQAPPLHQPAKTVPPKKTTAKKPPSGDLSKKLQESHGTIKPPASVDPGMVATPPQTGGGGHSMPVIPPPGTPGGNPHVVPQ